MERPEALERFVNDVMGPQLHHSGSGPISFSIFPEIHLLNTFSSITQYHLASEGSEEGRGRSEACPPSQEPLLWGRQSHREIQTRELESRYTFNIIREACKGWI